MYETEKANFANFRKQRKNIRVSIADKKVKTGMNVLNSSLTWNKTPWRIVMIVYQTVIIAERKVIFEKTAGWNKQP